MKIAVFSDVHGNRFALQAVAEQIERHQPDAWVNLGDQVFGSADPAGAWALQQQLRSRFGVQEIRGNTDEVVGGTRSGKPKQRELLDWLARELPAGAGDAVAALPTALPLAEGEVLAAHGTPSDPWTYLLRDTKPSGWSDDCTVLERLGDVGKARVVIVGHSHLEHVRQLGDLTVVNCGAVSRQKDGSPLARWVLLEGKNGIWNVSFMRVRYDTEAAAQWARMHAPNGDAEAQQLLTGQEPTD